MIYTKKDIHNFHKKGTLELILRVVVNLDLSSVHLLERLTVGY